MIAQAAHNIIVYVTYYVHIGRLDHDQRTELAEKAMKLDAKPDVGTLRAQRITLDAGRQYERLVDAAARDRRSSSRTE